MVAMRSRRTSRLVSLAALLPLLAAVAGVGYDRFRCTFTGEVSETGCCPSAAPPRAGAPAVVDAASCCAHETAHAAQVPAESCARPLLLLDVAAARPQVPARLAISAAVFTRLARAQAPPRPSIVLLKQSFLI
jgi:hypothetical protein